MEKSAKFQRIALMGGHRHNHIEETLLTLHTLLTKWNYPVVVDEETAKRLPFAVDCVPVARLGESCDLLIVIGGDGSLLQAAKIAVSQSLPVLGVNRGRLGFLTDIYPQDLGVIEQILEGEYREEERFLLRGDIYHHTEVVDTLDALNEIVLSPGDVSHMIEFEVMVGDQFVCDLRADGLIVATPTGSTAYALSGGGPILHPRLNAMVLVPMFPHTLSNRPLVVDADKELVIQITQNNEATPFVSGDGQKRFPIALGDSLHIYKTPEPLRLIHPLNYQYFQTLRAKLGWQSKAVS